MQTEARRVLAEAAMQGGAVFRVVRTMAGDYATLYEENGRGEGTIQRTLEHALFEFGAAVREAEMWALVAEAREED